ncbi:MAG TPA: NADH-quinone oxidoreductase subunit J, partial [Isosphaeraceae bacterium]|nr:NADH-quinone oxidoreductase subunit J [Isosphaeraceae bacterium]
ARNLVHAALFLVAFFFLVACQFVLLEVDFLAAVQVLLYIGAVAILMMFGIMLTRNIQGEEPGRTGWLRWIPPGAVALGMLAMLSRGLLAEPVSEEAPHWDRQARPTLTDADDSLSPRGDVVANLGQVIGQELLGRWIVPFEMAGLLLTAALVGSVAVAMGAREEMPARGIPDLGRSQERTLR